MNVSSISESLMNFSHWECPVCKFQSLNLESIGQILEFLEQG
jgi:hypothetical protein